MEAANNASFDVKEIARWHPGLHPKCGNELVVGHLLWTPLHQELMAINRAASTADSSCTHAPLACLPPPSWPAYEPWPLCSAPPLSARGHPPPAHGTAQHALPAGPHQRSACTAGQQCSA
eukprot:1161122-Pelagomonas_calceolata.AAC.6